MGEPLFVPADGERDSKIGAKGPGGLLQIAAAAKCAPASSADAKALAALVMREAAEDLGEAPSEYETADMIFRRQMDALLDAANGSHGFAMRSARRVHLARAMEKAGVVLVDVAQLAKLVVAKIERIERAALPCTAAECEAAGGEHHNGRLWVDSDNGQLYAGEYGTQPIGDFIGDVGRDPMPDSRLND